MKKKIIVSILAVSLVFSNSSVITLAQDFEEIPSSVENELISDDFSDEIQDLEEDETQTLEQDDFVPAIEEASETEEKVTSGTCGDSLVWEIDEEGTLTISGEGEMEGFEDVELPWESIEEDIINIVVEKEVESISDYAFV